MHQMKVEAVCSTKASVTCLYGYQLPKLFRCKTLVTTQKAII
jgi:hypothetical protein